MWAILLTASPWRFALFYHRKFFQVNLMDEYQFGISQFHVMYYTMYYVLFLYYVRDNLFALSQRLIDV